MIDASSRHGSSEQGPQPFPSVVGPVQAAMSNKRHGRSPVNAVQERHEAGGHVGFISEPVLSMVDSERVVVFLV